MTRLASTAILAALLSTSNAATGSHSEPAKVVPHFCILLHRFNAGRPRAYGLRPYCVATTSTDSVRPQPHENSRTVRSGLKESRLCRAVPASWNAASKFMLRPHNAQLCAGVSAVIGMSPCLAHLLKGRNVVCRWRAIDTMINVFAAAL